RRLARIDRRGVDDRAARLPAAQEGPGDVAQAQQKDDNQGRCEQGPEAAPKPDLGRSSVPRQTGPPGQHRAAPVGRRPRQARTSPRCLESQSQAASISSSVAQQWSQGGTQLRSQWAVIAIARPTSSFANQASSSSLTSGRRAAASLSNSATTT